MIMKMVSRGLVMVAGVLVTQKALDKLEKSNNKREIRIKKEKDTKVKENEKMYKADILEKDGTMHYEGYEIKAFGELDMLVKLKSDFPDYVIVNVRLAE